MTPERKSELDAKDREFEEGVEELRQAAYRLPAEFRDCQVAMCDFLLCNRLSSSFLEELIEAVD